jgi:hypothetical protein
LWFSIKKSIFEPTSTTGSAVSNLEWHSQAAKTDLVIQGFIFK